MDIITDMLISIIALYHIWLFINSKFVHIRRLRYYTYDTIKTNNYIYIYIMCTDRERRKILNKHTK